MEQADMGTAGDRTQVRRPEKNKKRRGILKQEHIRSLVQRLSVEQL
jgi:hypothetical protein